MNATTVKKIIRDIPDFPQKGVIFKDITPILKDPAVYRFVIDTLTGILKPVSFDAIVGIESRGFMFGTALAYQMKKAFVPVRKKGKLPYRTVQMSYALEYGEAVVEMHEDAIKKDDRVVIVDDLLATGGTALAAAQLVEKLGGKVEKYAFVIELLFFKGREKLSAYDVDSLVQF
ncbi:MAG: adenine phosphoribosyltransferase [Candidatus Omnitrophica bacterium]|nr:adenine phosphoribosyltransferase [Candidatus Omnitrophota bacterium]MDD5672147.1 adenine phosphoribosyltransferase [Candidatus Omnitrophota bacterium]